MWFGDPRKKPRRQPPLRVRRNLRGVKLVASFNVERPNALPVTVSIVDPWMRFYDRPGYAIGVGARFMGLRIYATRRFVMPIEDAYRVAILMQSVLIRSTNTEPFDELVANCLVAVELSRSRRTANTPALRQALDRVSRVIGFDRLERIRTKSIDTMPSWIRERIEVETSL